MSARIHQRCVRRERYRFVGRVGDSYVWQRRIPGDSRVEEISVRVRYFWASPAERAQIRAGS